MTRALTVGALLLLASTAWAQKPTRVRISANFFKQLSESDVTDTISFSESLETASVTSRHAIAAGPGFDVNAGVTIVKNFGVFVGVSRFSKDGTGTIDGQIPHPFFFAQRRTLSGETPLTRDEFAVHVDAMILLPLKLRKFEVAVFAGPSFFSVGEDFVDEGVYADDYPYDSVTFSSAKLTRASKSAVGFNAGADVTYKLTRSLGVGGLIRASTAGVDLPNRDAKLVNVSAGGLQVGVGVRLRF